MRRIVISIFSSLIATIIYSQDNLIIHGKIELLSQSKYVILNGTNSFKARINTDGTFEIKGRIEESGLSFILTDSSGADGMWLEPGEYTIHCKEISMQGIKKPLFRIPFFEGPRNATLYHGFVESLYYIKGAGEDRKKNYRNFATSYMDSMFRVCPDCKVIPDLVNFALDMIGDSAAAVYQQKFTASQQMDSSAKQLWYHFSRKQKMEKEKVFEDFTMKKPDDNDFRLSSLTDKKLILIDFWSASCYPCRKKHEHLVQLYQKYADKGLAIVSVALDDNKKTWLKSIRQDNMTWINVSELKGWKTSLAENYFIKMLPYSIWLDGDRKIIDEELTDKQIEERLNR